MEVNNGGNMVESGFNLVSNLLFGNDTSMSGQSTTENPVFRDSFFHPLLIEDTESCKMILHTKVTSNSVRLWDILLLIPNLSFLLLLFYRFPTIRTRLSSPVTKSLYMMVITCGLVSFLRCLLAILTDLASPTRDITSKIIWIITRSILLSMELSIAFLKPDTIVDKRIIFACSTGISLLASGIQAYLEIFQPFYGFQLQDGSYLYGQGGPEFLACFSYLLVIFYLSLTITSTTSRSYITYYSIQLLLAVLSGVGATLLALKYHSGMCLIDLTSFTTFSLLGPLAYFCLLHPWQSRIKSSLMFVYKAQQDEELLEEELREQQ